VLRKKSEQFSARRWRYRAAVIQTSSDNEKGNLTMPDWKQLATMTPEPSLLDAIAFAEGELTILEYVRYIRNADDFVAHLRTLPDAEAVALVKQAMREGDKRHNQQELFRNRAFTQWMVDMATYIDTFGQGQ
jgi:hypothetical protein